jgi:hypothetical protein
MSTFIERLLQEETELNEKKSKLESFIGTENFKTIAKEQQALLKIQVNAMTTYSEVLNQRIILIYAEEAANHPKTTIPTPNGSSFD